MPALRLMGAVHRLVLGDDAPALAAHFPSAGGAGDPASAWPAFRDLLAERRDRVRELVARPVQTNEPGRCAALLGALLLAEERVGGNAGATPAAPADRDVFAGARRPRRSEEDRQKLRAYVWADMAERRRRLDAALDLAAARPERVERAGAADWLRARLRHPVQGRTTVVVHTIVMQYVTEGERAEVDALLEAAGARATPRAPLARLSMEPGGARADVRLRLWPGGEEQLVARSGYHGPPVEWLG